MAKETKQPPTLADYMANRVKTLNNELQGAIRHRDAMLQVVGLNPDDSWAAGMARHYTRRAEQLAEQLSAAINAAEKTISGGNTATTAETSSGEPKPE